LTLVGLDLAMMFHPVAASHIKKITSQFFAEMPKVMDDMGYYDWVSSQMKN